MNIIWILDIDAEYGPRHGGTLRYMHLSRGLVARGHKVYFLIVNRAGQVRGKRNEYLETLRDKDCLTDFVEVDECSIPPTARKLSRLAIHPGAQLWLLSSYQTEFSNQITGMLKDLAVDVTIVSYRPCLFLLPQLSSVCTTIIDWCDSAVLFEIREICHLFKMGKLRQLPPRIKELVYSLIDEAYYGRCSAANIVVARSDKQVLDCLNGKPSANRLLQNGVEQSMDSAPTLPKDPNRLIFSGSMDFSPNYDGALWFIKHVMPLLIKKRREIRLVIAGQQPISDLLECESENVRVTGLVPNLRAEIQRSALYVAPLISGSGFRNKLVEAIASGTYVIGTPMALECLDEQLRRTLLMARTAEEFARRIEEYITNPGAFGERLNEAMHIVRERYQWGGKVMELEAVCYQALRRRAEATR